MAQFVGIASVGTDQYLRNRLRSHLAKIKKDDYEIEKEGLENLTEDELRVAARARALRAPFGEGAVVYMQRWVVRLSIRVSGDLSLDCCSVQNMFASQSSDARSANTVSGWYLKKICKLDQADCIQQELAGNKAFACWRLQSVVVSHFDVFFPDIVGQVCLASLATIIVIAIRVCNKIMGSPVAKRCLKNGACNPLLHHKSNYLMP